MLSLRAGVAQGGVEAASRSARRWIRTLPATIDGGAMNRRTFLTRGPGALVALSSGGGVREDPSPNHQRAMALLEAAERAHVQAHDLIHWPWRYHEARPALEDVVEKAAQAWLLDRGIESKLGSRHTWMFIACDRRDEITGIGWRAMHLALCDVQRDCDPLGHMANPRDFVGTTRATLITRARATLIKSLNSAALCLEGVRAEVVHRVRVGAHG